MRKWNFREFQVQVNLPYLIWSWGHLMWQIATLIHVILNWIKQSAPPISHIFLYLSIFSLPLSSFRHLFIHNCPITGDDNVQPSLFIFRRHDPELLSDSIQLKIDDLQLVWLYFHGHELIPQCILSSWHDSIQINCHSPALHKWAQT